MDKASHRNKKIDYKYSYWILKIKCLVAIVYEIEQNKINILDRSSQFRKVFYVKKFDEEI